MSLKSYIYRTKAQFAELEKLFNEGLLHSITRKAIINVPYMQRIKPRKDHFNQLMVVAILCKFSLLYFDNRTIS
jgi:hypothetical protein